MSDWSERRNGKLRNLLDDADELAEHDLPAFEELGEGEQDIWRYGWPNKMERLEDVLEPAYCVGEMSAKQEERYQELKAKFTETASDLGEQFAISVSTCVLKE